MWQHYFRPRQIDEALSLLAEHSEARVVAGGTDLIVELRRGARPTDTLIDLTAIDSLRYVVLEQNIIRIGALATHNDIIAAPFARRMLPLAQASREVGAPQIRAAATVAGNIVTASPANDTITALMALGATIELVSRSGARMVPIGEFYTGVRRTVLRPGELVREIRIPALGDESAGLFLKLGLRRAQAISVVNAAMVVRGSRQPDGLVVSEARIALGCVAPTIVRCAQAEAHLVGRLLDQAACEEAGRLAVEAARPIDDIRASAAYRRSMVAALVAQGLQRIAEDRHADGWDETPVLLETHISPPAHATAAEGAGAPDRRVTDIPLTLNGARETLVAAQGRTLLDALRDAGATGVKEGCAEGECGACTIWLNGRAVMACLTPAAQAHDGEVTTIEGLARDGVLHPVQRAFIEHGAVQCGFCTPGFLMAAARLLEEHPAPTVVQVQTAVSGNICRCTGYQQIVQAILDAAQRQEPA